MSAGDAGGLARVRRWAASLKVRVALASVLLVAAGVFTAAALVLAQARERTAEILREAEAANAQRLAAIVGQRLTNLQTALRSAAAAVPLEQLDDRAALQAYMQQRQVTATLFATLTLVDAGGRTRVLRDEAGIRFPEISLADRAHIRRTLDQGVAVISEPVLGRTSEEPMLYFTMPVRRGDGQMAALLSAGLRLSSRDLLTDLVLGAGGPSGRVTQRSFEAQPHVETVIVDRQGRVLAHPDSRLVMQPVQEDARLAAAWAAVRASGVAQAASSALPQAASGALIVAAAPVPQQDWTVLRLAPAEQMLAGFEAGRAAAVRLALAVAVVTGLALLGGLVWLLRPLEQLERRARRLAVEGEPAEASEAGWPQAGGEIGELVHALREAVRRRSQAEQATRSLMGQLHSMLHTAPIGIAFTRERRFERVSDEFCRLLGYADGELEGEPALIIHASKADYEALGPRVAEAFAQRQEFCGDCEFVRRDGSHFVGELKGRPVVPGEPQAGTIWLLRDVTAERAAYRELAWSASHDPLTGLANRRHFEAELQRLLPEVGPESPAAALFVDLDHFKVINDTAGHAAGDQVLREVAAALQAGLRRDELVARLGGDEFAVVLMHCELEAAVRVAEKLRAALQRIEIRHVGRRLPVGASIGVVAIPPQGASVAGVLQLADEACYAAKGEGRNRVHAGPAQVG
ncbi:MAG: diguanylate cyclase [Burkholderiaceae bacterium]|nr:diguanylate cyclase [Burkholderiaceae bacterium]